MFRNKLFTITNVKVWIFKYVDIINFYKVQKYLICSCHQCQVPSEGPPACLPSVPTPEGEGEGGAAEGGQEEEEEEETEPDEVCIHGNMLV